MNRCLTWIIVLVLCCSLPLWAGGNRENAFSEPPISKNSFKESLEVTDALGRKVEVPADPEHVICSGPGALRLLTYLQKQDRAVAVDDMEVKRAEFDARPYAMANPQFKELPIFGEFRGHDNPELILGLDPQPQVIFKTFPESGYDAAELQKRTGIPVVSLNYGDLNEQRDSFYESLRTMGSILHAEERAEEIISFIEGTIEDLESRTANIADEERVSCYVGGIAYRGPHGIQSTEPAYPPFLFIHADNTAFQPDKPAAEQLHADIAKEQIIMWNPEVIFIDVSTVQSGDTSSAIYELNHEGIYNHLQAKTEGEIYGVLPYNWYTQNFGSILADAYYIGSVLYPERFSHIHPQEKADEIYTFLVGEPVFEDLKASFGGFPFEKIYLK